MMGSVAGSPTLLRPSPGLDPSRLHDLADDLEAHAFAVTTRKLRRALKK
jgi:hypothetical protein